MDSLRHIIGCVRDHKQRSIVQYRRNLLSFSTSIDFIYVLPLNLFIVINLMYIMYHYNTLYTNNV